MGDLPDDFIWANYLFQKLKDNKGVFRIHKLYEYVKKTTNHADEKILDVISAIDTNNDGILSVKELLHSIQIVDTVLKREKISVTIDSNAPLVLPSWSQERHDRQEWRALLEKAKQLYSSAKSISVDKNEEIQFLRGHTNTISMAKKAVSVFISSTFTDTETERNTLLVDVYPYLSELCSTMGFSFGTVDMRWGVRDSSSDNHKTSELCIRELYHCLNSSAGPAFVSILGDKNGYRPFPPQIEKEEFETILNNLRENKKDTNTLLNHFKLDENSIPPSYILLPITAIYPLYRSNIISERQGAAQSWWRAFETMQLLLREGSASMDPHIHEKYVISVTEDEVHHGIINNKKSETQSLYFRRDIDGVATYSSNPDYGLFVDLGGDRKRDNEAKDLLDELKQKVELSLGASRKSQFLTPYPSSKDPSYMDFVKQFSDDVCLKLSLSIIEGFEKNNVGHNTEVTETLYHQSFVAERSSSFVGKEQQIKHIASLLNIKSNKHAPTIIFGNSGSGKTSLVAQIVKEARKLINIPNLVVVYRFIGITPVSSNMSLLLSSLCRHLYLCYNKPVPKLYENDLEKLVEEFKKALVSLPTNDSPLLLVLDSVDQLIGEIFYDFLPFVLPKNVSIVVSTIPGGWLDFFRTRIPENCFSEVLPLSVSEGLKIFDSMLKKKERNITLFQRSIVLTSFRKCPSPLFLDLCTHFASKWSSFTSVEEVNIQAFSITSLINTFFLSLEETHGKVFTTFALGLITAAKEGISSEELEDIISCNEDVLTSIYEWWEPPIRRCPSLLWRRLQNDLNGFISEKGSFKIPTQGWFHRQFWEVAEQRYLGVEEDKIDIHTMLANYFEGIWYNKPIEYYNKATRSRKSSIRYVSPQPYIYDGGNVNYRKLVELPYHLQKMKNIPRLVSVICHFQFIQASFLSGTQFSLLSLYDSTAELCSGELKDKIHGFKDFVYRNLNYLSSFPGRVFQQAANSSTSKYLKEVKPFLKRPYKWLEQINRPPKDPLSYVFNKHSTAVCSVDVFEDYLLTAAIEVIYLWSINTGKCLLTMNNRSGSNLQVGEFGQRYATVKFSHDGHYFASSFLHLIRIWDTKTGTLLRTFEGHETGEYLEGISSVCWSPDQSRIMSVSHTSSYQDPVGQILVWDTQNCQLINTVTEFDYTTKAVAFSAHGFEVQWEDKEDYTYHTFKNNEHVHTKLSARYNGISANGDFLNIANEKCSSIYTANKTQCFGSIDKLVTNTAVSNDGKYVAFPIGKVVYIYTRGPGEKYIHTNSFVHEMDIQFSKFKFTHDNKRLVTYGVGTSVILWDVTVEQDDIFERNGKITSCSLVKAGDSFIALVSQPNGLVQQIDASGHNNKRATMTAFDSESKQKMSELYTTTWNDSYTGFAGKAISCITHDYSDNCFVGFDDGSSSIINLTKLTQKGGLIPNIGYGISCAKFFPNSKNHFITAHENGDVKIWKDYKEVDKYQHKAWVHCNAISPDGKVATFSVDHKIIVRYNQQSIIINLGTERGDWVNCMSFSTCSSLLATGCEDGKVVIYDLKNTSSENIASKVVRPHSQLIYAITFYGPNHIITVSADHTTKILNIPANSISSIPLSDSGWMLFDFAVDEDKEETFLLASQNIGAFAFFKIHYLPKIQPRSYSFSIRKNSPIDMKPLKYIGALDFRTTVAVCYIKYEYTMDNIKPGYYIVHINFENNGYRNGALFITATGDNIRGTHTVWNNTTGILRVGMIKVMATTSLLISIKAEQMDWKQPDLVSNAVTVERISAEDAKNILPKEEARKKSLA